tara:strand:- start:271 stop:480 length:210 start_codon:yes stop_codon:yes gene_type:complete
MLMGMSSWPAFQAIGAATPQDGAEPSAVIETGGGAAYARSDTDGDLCTEASIDPHLAASLGKWMPTLFA